MAHGSCPSFSRSLGGCSVGDGDTRLDRTLPQDLDDLDQRVLDQVLPPVGEVRGTDGDHRLLEFSLETAHLFFAER